MVNYHKVRVTRDNIRLIQEAIYPNDQRHAIRVGDVVSTVAYRNDEAFVEGQITVLHSEGQALKWDRDYRASLQGSVDFNTPSERGTWIDGINVIIIEDGTMFGLDGRKVQS